MSPEIRPTNPVVHVRHAAFAAFAAWAGKQFRTEADYSDQAAGQSPRRVLMRTAAWQDAAGLSNTELADAFNVPLDQVVQRHLGLARQGWWQLAPEAVR